MAPTQQIPYLSDIAGSTNGRPLFIVGSFLVALLHTLYTFIDRSLHHTRHVNEDPGVKRLLISILTCFFTLVGGIGLVILSLFDSYKHLGVHNPMIGMFIGGYMLAACVLCLESMLLSKADPDRTCYRLSYRIKAALITCELVLTAIFGILNSAGLYDQSAVTEWTISGVFVFYLWSFAIDSWTPTFLTETADKTTIFESWAMNDMWRLKALPSLDQEHGTMKIHLADELSKLSKPKTAAERRFCYRKMSY